MDNEAMDAQGENVPTNRATSMKSADIQITDTAAFLKEKNRHEAWCAVAGALFPVAVMTLYELGLHQYASASLLKNVMRLFFVLSLITSVLLVINLHAKLQATLPAYSRKDLLKELELLQALNNPSAWRIYRFKMKIKLIGAFSICALLANALVSSVHLNYFGK
ncbi:MAG: hypothetical protein ACKVOO_08990 [Burkholderiaceae bacterium]